MKAILLAAGRGSRLKPHTDTTPKSLLSIGTTSLIERTIDLLHGIQLNDISVVVGYRKEMFHERLESKGIRFFENPNFETTDQAGSLIKAAEVLNGDSIIITADLYSSPDNFDRIQQSKEDVCLAIEKRQKGFDNLQEKIVFNDGKIKKIGKLNVTNEEAEGEFLGLTKISKDFCSIFVKKMKEVLTENPKAALVHVFQRVIDEGAKIGYIESTGPWCEMDDEADWNFVRKLEMKEH